MSCKICKRNSCCKSFHSQEEQDRYDEKQEMSDDVDDLRDEILQLKQDIKDLTRLIESQKEEIFQLR